MTRYNAKLPIVGIPTFFNCPVHEALETLDADVAFLGIPYDWGTGFRPGSRFGPRDLRNYSMRLGARGTGTGLAHWNPTTGRHYLEGVRAVDSGDVDMVMYDYEQNSRNIRDCVGAILARGVLPVLIGGDHSVTFPIVEAFGRYDPLHIVHFDAHMDYIDHIEGVRHTNGSPFRRAAELPYVGHMTHLGIRHLRTSETDHAAARARGNQIITREQIRREGVDGVLARLPAMEHIYISIDIDGFDPSIAPGTTSPSPDGVLYHEFLALMRGVAARGRVVGFDFVELNPMLDPSGRSTLLAAHAILEVLAAIFEQR